MFTIGTRVKIKQDALLNEKDFYDRLKIRVNESPLRNATGVIIGRLGDMYYVTLDNEHLFVHDAQNVPIAISEKNLEVLE